MAEAIRSSAARLWTLRAAFVLIAVLLIMFSLLPLETTPRLWAGPDLMLAFVLVWAIRRPDLAPIPLVAGVFLLADLLQMRPPGLMAAIATFAINRLQRNARSMRDRTFLAEWAAAAASITVIIIGYRLARSVFLLENAQLAVALSHWLMTVVSYPLMVLFSSLFFGLRRTAPGEVDDLGHKL